MNNNLKMAKLYIMIGLPCSGKDNVIKKYAKKGDVILSSDDIRTELFGFENQEQNGLVFDTMNKRCREALSQGKNVFYNATNLNCKRRMALVDSVKRYTNDINAILCIAPIETVLGRNLIRPQRHIPEDKMLQMFKTMDIPMSYEGYKNIYIINTNDKRQDKFIKKFLLNIGLNYDQESEHHNETLMGHLLTTSNKAFEYSHDKQLKIAGRFHDIGKPYVREWSDGKQKFIYYEHHRISAYLYLLYYSCKNSLHKLTKVDNNVIETATLIYHHMDRFTANLGKVEELLGNKLYSKLEILMKADTFRKEC